MTKPNFTAMSDKELRAYVLANKDDYCDRIYAKPGLKVTSMEQFKQLVKEKEKINKSGSEIIEYRDKK